MKNNEKNTCEKDMGGVEPEIFREKNLYRERIIEMVGKIQNEKHIKMIYGFVKRLHEE